MSDIILMVYAHDHKHKQFIQFWREFRERHPEAINTPELARIEIYNLRYDPQDKFLVKKELNSFIRGNNILFLKKDGLIMKIMTKIFSKVFQRKFGIFQKSKEKPFIQYPLGAEFNVTPIFEKEDSYKWNKNQ